MYRVILPWLVGIALWFGGPASAQAGPFFGIGGALINFDDGVDEIEPKNVFFRLGASVNPYVDLGAEISISLISDEVDFFEPGFGTFDVDFDVETTFFFVKLNAPIDDSSRFYLMIGPSDVEVTGSEGGLSVSADDSDTGIGLGFETSLKGGGNFTIDYIRYFDDEGAEVTGLNFGYMARF